MVITSTLSLGVIELDLFRRSLLGLDSAINFLLQPHLLSFKFLLILGFVLWMSYLLGWGVSIGQLNQTIPTSFVNLVKQVDLYLSVPITLDLIIVGLLLILNRTNN